MKLVVIGSECELLNCVWGGISCQMFDDYIQVCGVGWEDNTPEKKVV